MHIAKFFGFVRLGFCILFLKQNPVGARMW